MKIDFGFSSLKDLFLGFQANSWKIRAEEIISLNGFCIGRTTL